MGEAYVETSDKEEIYAYLQWRTESRHNAEGFGNTADGAWIQSYAQWEDPLLPGTYSAVTCNVAYAAKAVTNFTVGNFYGEPIN